MLERETELIKQIIVESTINGRDAVKLNEVVAAELPRGVKAFMTTQVVSLLESDLSSHLAQITKSLVSGAAADRAMLRSLAMEFVLRRDEFLKLVEDTVHFLENYLCRPQWTLNNVMFEKSPDITFNEMTRKLELAVEYSYFRILIERHALRNGWKTITSDQFKSLVGKIDCEVVKKHSPRELALLTKPIYDFLLFGDSSMDRPVPLGAILLFFDDKGMSNEKDHIERMYRVRSRNQISMNELVGILEELSRVQSAVHEEVEKTELEILSPRETIPAHEESSSGMAVKEIPGSAEATMIKPKNEQLPESIEEVTTNGVDEQAPDMTAVQTPVPAEETRVTPLEEENIVVPTKIDILSTERDDHVQASNIDDMPNVVDAIFFDATHDERAETPSTKLDPAKFENDVPPVDAHIPTVVNAALLTQFAKERQRLRDAIMGMPDNPRKDLQGAERLEVDDALTVEDRAKYIRRIFKGNGSDYGIFIHSINKARSWREAQVHLRQLFELNKLDVLSPDVIEFTDAMQARFTPDPKKP